MYPEDLHIDVNGRKTTLKAILAHDFPALDQEENSFFNFCRSWFSGQDQFEQKTSGSTGTPKTIFIEREKMIISAKMTNDFLAILTKDVSLVCLSVNYIAGKMMVVRALINNQPILFYSPTANPLLDIPEKQQVDFIALVPYQLKNIIENTTTLNKLNTIKNIIIGGAPIDIYLENQIKRLVYTKIYQTFGMTETVSHIALRDLKTPSSTYKVLKGVEIGKTSEGCLTIQSRLTGEEPLITHDLVELISSDSFRWIGRSDNVINSGGIKIQIESLEKEIALLLATQGTHNRIIVFSKPNKDLGETVQLLVEGTIDNLDCLKSLPAFYQPKKVHTVPHFLETPTQKVDRQKTIDLLA